jgi:hypothetical protein
MHLSGMVVVRTTGLLIDGAQGAPYGFLLTVNLEVL